MISIARRWYKCVGIASALFAVALGSPSWSQEEQLPATKAKKADENVMRFTGHLSKPLPSDKVRANCYHQVHTVKMKAELEYTIDMRRTNPGGDPFDPYLRIEDTSGVNLAEDDDSGGGQAARILFSPAKDGDYRVIVTTCSPYQEGDYELIVVGRPPGTPPAPPGMLTSAYQPVEFGDILVTPLALPYALASGPGGASRSFPHGYVEYRFEIENRSAKNGHQVTLVMPRHRGNDWGPHLRSIKKTVEVAPEATVHVSLFQPDLPVNGGNTEVLIDGTSQERDVGVPVVRTSSNHRLLGGGPMGFSGGPGAFGLVTVLTGADVATVIQANVYKSSVGGDPKSGGGGSPFGMKSGTFVEKGSPHNNKPYSYLFNHSIVAANPEALTTRSWLGFSPYDGVVLNGTAIDALPPETRAALWQYVECGGTLCVVGKTKLPESWRVASTDVKGCAAATPGFGKCLVINNTNIARWSPDEWKLLAETWDQSRAAWNQLSTITQSHIQFPVVENLGIPVRGLFAFMFGFVVLIGPVNIFWLSRTNRRLWLLWTVPVFSLLTTGLLFAYMALSEGWHAHVRGVGITVLDENSQRASSIGWLGFYSPTTSRGLHFSLDTELSPHLEPEASAGRYYRGGNPGRSFTIDWTSDQHLDSGWVTAKVPLHFLVRRSEKRLERLPARRDGEDIVVVNGLKVDIKTLRLADRDGFLYTGEKITAGAEGRLKKSGESVGKAVPLHEKFSGNWLNLARDLRTSDQVLQAGTYLAVLEDSPFLEQGLRDTQSRAMEAVVFGVSKEAP